MTQRGDGVRRGVIGVVLAAQLAAQAPVEFVWRQGTAFAADTTPPSILHDPPDAPIALDHPFLVTAVVDDDAGVAGVRLHFRVIGAEEYQSVEMTRTTGGRYTATIPAHRRSVRAVEYFIAAEDVTGNVALRGGAYSPLLLASGPLGLDDEGPVERLTMTTADEPVKPWYKRWWVWTLAGAVVLGAVAAGGGGGGDDEEPSGTATITAPIP